MKTHSSLRVGRALRGGLVGALLLLAAAAHAQGPTPWTTPQHNPSRTGRAPGVGDITQPSASWQVSIGGEVPGASVRIDDVNNDGSADYLSLVDGALVARGADDALLWDTPPLGVTSIVAVDDFNGDGRSEILLIGRHAVLVDGESGQVTWRLLPGAETSLSFRAGIAVPINVDDDPEKEILFAEGLPKRVALFDFSQGFEEVSPVWTNTDAALPTAVIRPVVGDFDGVAETREVALVNQLYCQAVFIDLATGQTLRVAGRGGNGPLMGLSDGLFCYGLYEAANIDDDPQDELVFTGALPIARGGATLTVYDYVQDATQWQYEYGVNTVDVLTLSPAGATADMDGDGVKEVVTAVYGNTAEAGLNDDGIDLPEQWSVAIYDGATGTTLGSLPMRSIVGFEDLDGDGAKELITRQASPGSTVLPTTGTIEVWGLDLQRQPTLRWTVNDAVVLTRPLDINTRVSSRDYGLVPGTIANGQDERLLLVAREGLEQTVQVEAVEFKDGSPANTVHTISLDGQVGAGLVHTGQGMIDGPHVVLRSSLGRFSVHRPDLSVARQLVLTGHVSDVVLVPLLPGESLQMIYRQATGALVAIDPTGASVFEAPQELWRVSVETPGEFLAFDRDADGIFEVVHSGFDADDVPFVEMLDAQGQRLWRRSLPESASAPFQLAFGRFGDAPGDGLDVAALGRLADGTSVTWAFEGDDGTTLAMHIANEAEVNRYPNRELLVIPAQNNNPYDDLLVIHYTTFERLRGDSLQREGAPGAFPPANSRPSSSGLLLSDEAEPKLYTKNFVTQTVLYDVNSQEALWTAAQPISQYAYEPGHAGFADANGDGLWDVAIPGLLGDLTVMDGVNGEVLYRVCLDGGEVRGLDAPATLASCVPIAPLSSVAVADIDGDEGQEFVVGGADGWLYALDVADGQASWQMPLSSRVHAPAIADIDGDGLLEVTTTTARSELIVVDNAQINPVGVVRDVALTPEGQVVNPQVDVDAWPRTDALAVAWEPAVGADGYLVSLTTLNNTEVIEPQRFDGVTEAVFEGLELIPGVTYVFKVIAVSDLLGAAPSVSSNGVAIDGGPPTITGLDANPQSFDIGAGESPRITALVEAAGITVIQSIEITVRNVQDEVVFRGRLEPGVSTYNLDFGWSGLDEQEEALPAGQYTFDVVATDAIDASASDSVAVDLIATPPQVVDLSPARSDFDLGLHMEQRFTAQAATAGAVPLVSAIFTIHPEGAPEAPIYTASFEPGSPSFDLDHVWDGLTDGQRLPEPGAYVASLQVTSAIGQTASATAPFNVLTTVPVVSGPLLSTGIFDLGVQESLRVQADARLPGEVGFSQAMLWIEDAQGQIVYSESFDVEGTLITVETSWDGTNAQQELATPGFYKATFQAQAYRGLSITSHQTFSVRTSAPTIDGLTITPNPFALGVERAVAFEAQVSTTGQRRLTSATITVTDPREAQVVFEATEALTEPTAQLRWSWSGVFDDKFVDPGQYDVRWTATNAIGQRAEQTSTFEITAPNPDIEAFKAYPSPFDLGRHTETHFTASLGTGGPAHIDSVRLVVRRAEDQVEVVTHQINPESNQHSLDFVWDGTDTQGNPVPPGAYEASLELINAAGRTSTDTFLLDVLSSPPHIVNFVSSANSINLAETQQTRFTAHVSTQGPVALEMVWIGVHDTSTGAVVYEHEAAVPEGANEHRVEVDWGGEREGGGFVDPGVYEAMVLGTNSRGVSNARTLRVEVVFVDAPPEDAGMPDVEPQPDVEEDAGDEPDTSDEPDMGAEPDVPEPDAADEPDAPEDPQPDADEEPADPPVVVNADDDSCGCQTPARPASPSPWWFGLMLLGGALVRLRRD